MHTGETCHHQSTLDEQFPLFAVLNKYLSDTKKGEVFHIDFCVFPLHSYEKCTNQVLNSINGAQSLQDPDINSFRHSYIMRLIMVHLF